MSFYKSFPLLVGSKREHRVDSVEELIEYINKWNGKKNLFASVVSYDEWSNINRYGRTFNIKKIPNYITAIIDRIYWDIDPDDDHPMNIHERTIYLSMALTMDKIKHYLVFSGSGYAVYAETDTYPVAPEKKKSTVRCIQEHYDRKAGQLFGLTMEEHGTIGIDADPTSYGDIARISRIIGSLNLKHVGAENARYCIFVSLDDIKKGRVLHMSKNGEQGKGFINNSELIKLAYWEEQAESYIDTSGEYLYEDGITEPTSNFSTEWHCVKQAFSDCKRGFYKQTGLNRERFIVLSFMVNTAYSAPQARGIVKENFHARIYQDMINESQLKHIYSQSVLFPSRVVLRKEGRCNECGLCPE